MVRINEHEEVDINPTELEGQRLVKSAIMSCKEPEFWEALMDAIDESNFYAHDYHLMSDGTKMTGASHGEGSDEIIYKNIEESLSSATHNPLMCFEFHLHAHSKSYPFDLLFRQL